MTDLVGLWEKFGVVWMVGPGAIWDWLGCYLGLAWVLSGNGMGVVWDWHG